MKGRPRRLRRGVIQIGRRGAALALAAAAAAALGVACGGGPGGTGGRAAIAPAGGAASLRVAKDRPPIAVVARTGDARGAVAVAVATGGIADARGAVVAVALAGVIEARLAAAGVGYASVTPGWDGYRARALVADAGEAARVVDALRAAMLAPIGAGDAMALDGARRKVAALAQRPMADAALVDSVRCTGEPFAAPGERIEPPSAEELEAWRQAAHGLGRVAFATAGVDALGEAAARALAAAASWPASAKVPPLPLPPPNARAVVYDATGTLAPGAARITVAVHAARPSPLVAAAWALGDPRGPLASRLGALDAPARVRSVTATAHPDEGCLAVALDIAARDLGSDLSGRIATAATLARQELAVDLDGAPDGAPPAVGESDPRDAAERAAWWTLSGQGSALGDHELRVSLAIGVADGRDAPAPDAAHERERAILSDMDRATLAWHAPVVESRTRVESGQGEMWLLLASPCGTSAEVDDDAGLGAAVVVATAGEAARAGSFAGTFAAVEPWVSGDALGVLAHGPALDGEAPAAHARRLADLAARSFAADPIDARAAADARGALTARASEHEGRLLATLGAALAPGHSSWLAPLGTAEGLSRVSDAAVVGRASALRGGPLRVAVLADVDQAEADVAVRAVDRWIARRPGEARACAASDAPAPRPGTYAVETAAGEDAEAWLAAPLPKDDPASRVSATWLAAALDAEGGLLSRALGGSPPLASSWRARVVGPPRAAALVVRIVAGQASLDDAVAQTRALFDRVHAGALDAADYARARAAIDTATLDDGLDPRARIAALFRSAAGPAPTSPAAGGPTLEALRTFAARALPDASLVIVAARPPRVAAGRAP